MSVKLELISKNNSHHLDEIKNIYEYSFPPEEKVDFELIKKSIFEESDFLIYAILYNNILAGFITYLKINNYAIGCYFAIKNDLRGKNIGTEALKLFQKQNQGNTIVGEIEFPISQDAERRLNFYKANGFIIKDYGYLQPPISPASSPLPLLIISYPHELSQEEYQQVRKILYEKVYHADVDLYK